MYESESESEVHSVVSNSLRPHEIYSPQNSPGQNTGVGSLSLLQGIFPSCLAPFYFWHFCFLHSLLGVSKGVNRGKLKIIKKMSSCRNRRGNAIQDTNCSKQQVLRVGGKAVVMGKKAKKGQFTESQLK